MIRGRFSSRSFPIASRSCFAGPPGGADLAGVLARVAHLGRSTNLSSSQIRTSPSGPERGIVVADSASCARRDIELPTRGPMSTDLQTPLKSNNYRSMPRSGWHHNDETRRHMSAAHVGKRHSAATRQKISDGRRGLRLGSKHSPESCAKMSASHRGKRFTPDHCDALSEAHL